MEEKLINMDTEVQFWPVMIATFFGSFLAILGMTTINVAIPVLIQDLQTDLQSVQWTLTGFMLATGIIAPMTGYLGDRLNTKNLHVGALIGFTLFSGFCAMAWSIHSLIAFRILQGIFCGIIMPVTMTIIYQVIPAHKQAYAISLWSLSATLAPAFGPTLAGLLIKVLDWRWLFLINVPFGVLSIGVALKYIPQYRVGKPKKFDLLGLITVVVSSSALLVAFSEGHKWGWFSWETLVIMISGILLLLVFIRRELSIEEPLLNLKIFRYPEYTYSIMLNCIITISLYSGTYLTPLFLQSIQHASALETGLILLPASLAMAICMPITGKLYDRIGPIWLIVAGVLFIGIGTWKMANLSVDISQGYIMFWMTIRNIGISLSMMPATNLGMSIVPPSLSGHASSISNWTRQGLGSFSIGLYTSMLTTRLVTHTSELSSQTGMNQVNIQQEAFTLSINDVYLVATIIVLGCIPIVFMFRKKMSKSNDAQSTLDLST